jgi:nicotinamidase-related amidase
VAPRIEALAERARRAKVGVIYVNDNFGHWRSDFHSTVARCSAPDSRGRAVAARLKPKDEDLFVLKPMHSGFFCTPLELLLRRLGSQLLVLCGFATNLCVAFTAHDAHMRGFRVAVPQDTTAANSEDIATQALAGLKLAVRADTRPSAAIDFDAIASDLCKRPA